jgi:hypothetical protein
MDRRSSTGERSPAIEKNTRRTCAVVSGLNSGTLYAVHHLTYARKYRERLDDLAGWCNQCHEFTHGKTDFDPKDGVLRCSALANRLKENRYSPGEEAKLLEELVQLRRKIQGIK